MSEDTDKTIAALKAKIASLRSLPDGKKAALRRALEDLLADLEAWRTK